MIAATSRASSASNSARTIRSFASARSWLAGLRSGASVTRSRPHEIVVSVGPAVPVELPRLADFLDLVEIHVPDEQLLVMGRAQIADELAARVTEVALAVEVVIAEVLLDPDPVDRPDEIAVRDGVADLLDPPEIFAEAARGGAGDEHHLGAVQPEGPGALGEVSV